MWNDPIVEEVRKVRATHLERFGHDLDAIVRDLMEREKPRRPNFRRASSQRGNDDHEGWDDTCSSRRSIRPRTDHAGMKQDKNPCRLADSISLAIRR
jgi:hypothetical protein